MSLTRTVAWAVALCAVIAAAAAGDYHYFYFKEARSFRLDATRVAVRATQAELAAQPKRDALRTAGLDTESLGKGPIEGWTFAPMPAGRQAGADVEQVIAAVAAADVGFVSPVFIGEDGGR